MSTTVNYGLYKPLSGEVGWSDLVDGNFDTIDAQLALTETKDNRDVPNGYPSLDDNGKLSADEFPSPMLFQSGAPASIAGFLPGPLDTAATVLLWVPMDRGIIFAPDFEGSYAKLRVATTNPLTLIIQQDGIEVAQVDFAAGGTTGAFSSGMALQYATGSIFALVGGGDPTAADLGFAFAGTRP